MDEYKENKEEYIRISAETRNKLTTLSATLIAGIYFLSDKAREFLFCFKIALLFYVITIILEIISGYLKSQHYALWFDKKINTIDFRESCYGILTEITWWVSALAFILGSVYFFMGLFKWI